MFAGPGSQPTFATQDKGRGLLVLLFALTLVGCRCQRQSAPAPPTEPARLPPRESAAVWIVADGMTPTDPRSPAMRRQAPQPIGLFAVHGETVSFQVVIQAGAHELEQISVDLDGFELEPNSGASPHDQPLAIEVSRFEVYPLAMARRSGGRSPGGSLGWAPGASPPGPAPGGTLDDALIPVEAAPAWAAYPLRMEPGQHRTVWIDVAIPEEPVRPGRYGSRLRVRELTTAQTIADLPVVLEVGRARLPYAALHTMVYFARAKMIETLGSEAAVEQYERLMHAHHLTTVMSLRNPADVAANARYLSGELFSSAQGYRGPGAGIRPNVVVLGAYGGLGDPNEAGLRTVETMLARLEALGIRDRPGELDVFLYAVDEQCASPRGAEWKRWLSQSPVAQVRALRVGHTCSEPPAQQAVDLVMVSAASYAPSLAEAAVRRGKHVWIYNGALPQTGSFLTDSWRLSLRANAWIQSAYGIERWFYWESAFWHDGNRGGQGPHDLFASAETFHNQDGDACNGDGVLVYPGQQPRFPAHSVGIPGVFPSIRLKQWRRGISDAGYLKLARAVDAARSDRLARSLVPAALDQAKLQPSPRWPTTPDTYEAARRELFDLVCAGP